MKEFGGRTAGLALCMISLWIHENIFLEIFRRSGEDFGCTARCFSLSLHVRLGKLFPEAGRDCHRGQLLITIADMYSAFYHHCAVRFAFRYKLTLDRKKQP